MGVHDYDITKYQPILYAAQSMDELLDVVGSFFDQCDDEAPSRFAASKAARA